METLREIISLLLLALAGGIAGYMVRMIKEHSYCAQVSKEAMERTKEYDKLIKESDEMLELHNKTKQLHEQLTRMYEDLNRVHLN